MTQVHCPVTAESLHALLDDDGMYERIHAQTGGQTVAITVLDTANNRRVTWHGIDGEVDSTLLEAADHRARALANGDGFAVGVFGIPRREAAQISGVIHDALLARLGETPHH